MRADSRAPISREANNGGRFFIRRKFSRRRAHALRGARDGERERMRALREARVQPLGFFHTKNSRARKKSAHRIASVARNARFDAPITARAYAPALSNPCELDRRRRKNKNARRRARGGDLAQTRAAPISRTPVAHEYGEQATLARHVRAGGAGQTTAASLIADRSATTEKPAALTGWRAAAPHPPMKKGGPLSAPAPVLPSAPLTPS
ncbi:MAG: hypothetical protein V4582_24705 [Pseudomonadota bacterium]